MASSIRPRVCSTRPVTSIFPDPGRSTPRAAPCGRPGPENSIEQPNAGAEHESLSPANAERLKQAFQQCRDMEGTLSEQLEAYAAAGREIFPAYGEAVDRLVARIHENGGGENAPRPGEAMPPFLLPDETGRLVSLKSLLDQRTGRGDVLSRPLVPLLPAQRAGGDPGPGPHQGVGRANGSDHAGDAGHSPRNSRPTPTRRFRC